MAKQEPLEKIGTVTKVLADNRYFVKLDNDREILAYKCGKMKKFSIRIVEGNKVKVAMTPYDLTRGRITKRQ